MSFPRGKRGIGQSFIEFALVLPVLLMTILVIIEAGRLFFTWMILEQSARAGVRFAVTMEYDPAHCISGAARGKCRNPVEEKQARVASIKDAVRRSLGVLQYDEDSHWEEPNYIKTTVCVAPRKEGDPLRYLPPDPGVPFDPADCINGDDPGGPGDFVSVTVDYNHQVLVPLIKDIRPLFHLNVRREARSESFRSNIPVFIATAPPSYEYPDTFTPTTASTEETLQPPAPTQPAATPGAATATPDCSLISIENVFRDDNEAHFIVRNGNEEFPCLVRSVFSWPDRDCEDLFHVTRMYFPYYSFHEYVYWNDTQYTSPVDSGEIHLYWPGDARPSTDWTVRFNVDDDQPIFGHFAADLTFEFPSWGKCEVSGAADFPRITKIPTDTPTPGASTTATCTHTPGGSTATQRVTRTRRPTTTATETPATEYTSTATATTGPTCTTSPTVTSTRVDGPGD